jgi:hypothetical protein
MSVRRLAVVVGFAVAAATTASAQARIMGTVRDSLGAPIVGAEVRIENAGRPVSTPRSGEFRLDGIKPGNVTLTIRRVGFAPYREVLTVYDGDNKVGAIVLVRIPAELDTVAIREQELFREYPLLREFEENRKLGLGQYVTRADLDRMQGGFIQQAFGPMRGLILVRSDQGNKTWIANSRVRSNGRTELEDYMKGKYTQGGLPFRETISPPNADSLYCFPQVYLDYSRLSTDEMAPNLGRFSPDQLQAIEVYDGFTNTPVRYMGNRSRCGVIVLHSRVIDKYKRRIARARDPNDGPTRSRIFASASVSSGGIGKSACPDCARGQGQDLFVGVTLLDRWVIGGRYAKWGSDRGGEQNLEARQALVEWYPHPEPAKVKWFLNAGLGLTTLELSTYHLGGLFDHSDSVTASNLKSFVTGTGVDIAIYRRVVLSPFFSYTRTIEARSNGRFCLLNKASDGTIRSVNCANEPPKPRVFSFAQFGTRIGWR